MEIRIRIGINTMSILNTALHTEAVAFAAPMFKFLFFVSLKFQFRSRV